MTFVATKNRVALLMFQNRCLRFNLFSSHRFIFLKSTFIKAILGLFGRSFVSNCRIKDIKTVRSCYIICILLLTLFLKLKWVKLHWVQGLSDFLVANLGFFFVPPGVALMLYFDVIKAEFIPIVVSTVISTILVLVSTGWVHQYIRRHARFSKHENSSNRSKAQDDGLSKQ